MRGRLGDSKNSGFEDLGRSVGRIVDSAIESNDFKELNEAVTKAISKALDTGAQAIRTLGDANLEDTTAP